MQKCVSGSHRKTSYLPRFTFGLCGFLGIRYFLSDFEQIFELPENSFWIRISSWEIFKWVIIILQHRLEKGITFQFDWDSKHVLSVSFFLYFSEAEEVWVQLHIFSQDDYKFKSENIWFNINSNIVKNYQLKLDFDSCSFPYNLLSHHSRFNLHCTKWTSKPGDLFFR